MKQKKRIILIIAFVIGWNGWSQVINGDFELVKPNFLPSNWGMDFIQNVVVNPSTGGAQADVIQYPWNIPYFVYATNESHTGSYAMELANGFNVTQNEVIRAQASIFNNPELDSPGWNAGVVIEPGTNVTLLGMHYKFLPAGDELGEASITVLNDQNEIIGETQIDLAPTLGNGFQYIYSLIPYTSQSSPMYMYITIKTAKEEQTPVFGTRLIVDNVVTHSIALNTSINGPLAKPRFSAIADVVEGQLQIRPGDLEGAVTYTLFDTTGKQVLTNTSESTGLQIYTIDIQALQAGTYILAAQDTQQLITQKIIKK
jgi:hypothetical protein